MNRKFFSTLIWVSFGISIFIFAFSNGEKTLTNALLTFGITVMYTLVIGVGNGLVNDFLSRKFSWVEQTRTRVIYGIIGTVLANVILVFLCNYINFIVIQGNDSTKFLSGNMAVSYTHLTLPTKRIV